MSQYELFKMNDGDSIKEMVQRFMANVNHLNILDRKFENEDLVHKVLYCWQKKSNKKSLLSKSL